MPLTIICPSCRQVVGTHERFCTHCGIPQMVSPQGAAILSRRQFWRRLKMSTSMLILMGICISLFVTFSQTLLRDLSFWQRGVTTQGEVTQVTDIVCRRYDKNRQLTSRGSSVNVRFHDLHQHIHEVSFAECNTNFYGLHPGDSITIVYLPDQPEVATLKDQLGLGFLPNSLYFPASIVCTTILFIGILFWPFVRGRLLRR